ncbi:MAG: hypothetical protein UHS49_06060 [Faecalimonas sp.]|nr:hypothetical protein [Faecalimonas sp.]
MKEKKNAKRLLGLFAMFPFIVIGAVCGFLFTIIAEEIAMENLSFSQRIFALALELLVFYLVFFLELVIHECGHLVFGLLTGYKFSSIRFGSWMWVRTEGKTKCKRLSLAGTGGQCLLCPPDMVDGKVPYVLYNLGGSILNLASALIFAVIGWLGRSNSIWFVICLMFCVIGAIIGLMNGIPIRFGIVDNDGYNALSLGKTPAALRAFWVQMKVNEQLTKGIRLKDMPAEWFGMPTNDELKNSMVAAVAVLRENYLMDMQKFEEVKETIDHLRETDASLVGLHQNLLICDRLYCELLGDANPEVIEMLLTKEQKRFMRQMKAFPSVIRTEYAIALLYEKDTAKAEKIKAEFEKIAPKYPYASDIECERELMERVFTAS